MSIWKRDGLRYLCFRNTMLIFHDSKIFVSRYIIVTVVTTSLTQALMQIRTKLGEKLVSRHLYHLSRSLTTKVGTFLSTDVSERQKIHDGLTPWIRVEAHSRFLYVARHGNQRRFIIREAVNCKRKQSRVLWMGPATMEITVRRAPLLPTNLAAIRFALIALRLMLFSMCDSHSIRYSQQTQRKRTTECSVVFKMSP